MPQQQQFKRKQLYIKKDFQFKFIIKFCIIVLAGSALSTVLLYLFSRDTVTSTFYNSRLSIKTTSEVILPAIIYTNLVTLAIISVAAIMITLYISHKIAGPIYRFEQDFRQIADGDLTKVIRLRQKDQLTELATVLNDFVGGVRGKVESLQSQIGDVADFADNEDSVEAVRARLKELRSTAMAACKTSFTEENGGR